MSAFDHTILYVDDVPASAGFYRSLLGLEPVDEAPSFVLFALPSGLMLGLSSRREATPAPGANGGGSEIACAVADRGEVDATCADWQARGLPILLPPTDFPFGRTFVAADPDGHRLRVFAPAAA